MEKLLVLLKSLKFLEAVCFIVAALLVQFAPQYAIESSVLLFAVVAVLKLFGVQPELRVKALQEQVAILEAVVASQSKKVKGRK